MLIYVIRHGQTDWNAAHRLQGQKDIPLNKLGREQATENGYMLNRILQDSISHYDFVASPLSRTRETMELLRTSMSLPPLDYRTDDRLIEVSFGDWEGHTIPELQDSYSERIEARRTSKWDFIPPGDNAESYEILSWRIGAWLASIEKPTICVSHGGVIRSLFRLITDMEKDEAADAEIPQDDILKVDTHRKTLEWIKAAE